MRSHWPWTTLQIHWLQARLNLQKVEADITRRQIYFLFGELNRSILNLVVLASSVLLTLTVPCIIYSRRHFKILFWGLIKTSYFIPTNNSHEIARHICPLPSHNNHCNKTQKISQNLLSATIVIGALRINCWNCTADRIANIGDCFAVLY